MVTITKPMLAGVLENVEQLTYPVLCTPKYDGIRCLKLDGKVVSRKFIEIPNRYIRKVLEALPDGVDGEIICPNKTFNETQSAVMTEDGEPVFTFVIFDYVKEDIKKAYDVRMWDLHTLKVPDSLTNIIEKAIPTAIYAAYQLVEYEADMVNAGYEGVMIRSEKGPYKCGRSTSKEGYLLKLKRFEDSEAVVIGFEERLHNTNEATKDELGHTKRSSHKANLIPMDTLGALIVYDDKFEKEFKIGTGFDDEIRKEIWQNKDKYLGKKACYKYQPFGMKEKPRIPSFKGFRDERDI
jgi:DNA ligase-1